MASKDLLSPITQHTGVANRVIFNRPFPDAYVTRILHGIDSAIEVFWIIWAVLSFPLIIISLSWRIFICDLTFYTKVWQPHNWQTSQYVNDTDRATMRWMVSSLPGTSNRYPNIEYPILIWNNPYCAVCFCNCLHGFHYNILECNSTGFSNFLVTFAVQVVANIILHIRGVALSVARVLISKVTLVDSEFPNLLHINCSCLYSSQVRQIRRSFTAIPCVLCCKISNFSPLCLQWGQSRLPTRLCIEVSCTEKVAVQLWRRWLALTFHESLYCKTKCL